MFQTQEMASAKAQRWGKHRMLGGLQRSTEWLKW